jgi:hypothetical protein
MKDVSVKAIGKGRLRSGGRRKNKKRKEKHSIEPSVETGCDRTGSWIGVG